MHPKASSTSKSGFPEQQKQLPIGESRRVEGDFLRFAFRARDRFADGRRVRVRIMNGRLRQPAEFRGQVDGRQDEPAAGFQRPVDAPQNFPVIVQTAGQTEGAFAQADGAVKLAAEIQLPGVLDEELGRKPFLRRLPAGDFQNRGIMSIPVMCTPRRASARLCRPGPQPISSSFRPGLMPINSTRKSTSCSVPCANP